VFCRIPQTPLYEDTNVQATLVDPSSYRDDMPNRWAEQLENNTMLWVLCLRNDEAEQSIIPQQA
jgi:hypothetical protein